MDLRNTYGLGRMETISSIVVGVTMVLAASSSGTKRYEGAPSRHTAWRFCALLLTAFLSIASLWLG
jgi:divalent metal cation (Fe/Co/Zn/Cd) transporter